MPTLPDIRTVKGVRIVDSPDSTSRPLSTADRDGHVLFSPAHWPVANSGRGQIGSLVALQLGMWQLIAALRPRTLDLVEYLRSGKLEDREMQFTDVYLDWPDMNDEHLCPPVATVLAPEGREYSNDDLRAHILEETLGCYGDGTVLKKVSHVTTNLTVEVWLANKDDRAGVAKAFEDLFLEAPDGEQTSRLVLIAPYFDQVARYTLKSMVYPDSPESAQSNQWTLQATFSSEIDVVKLVDAPPSLTIPQPSLDI